jgi:hypothetical protein
MSSPSYPDRLSDHPPSSYSNDQVVSDADEKIIFDTDEQLVPDMDDVVTDEENDHLSVPSDEEDDIQRFFLMIFWQHNVNVD